MSKKPKAPAPDPNLEGFRAILEKKKQAKAAAEVAKPADLTHKQKPRVKPQMRRRP
jgi:hypothetical protein